MQVNNVNRLDARHSVFNFYNMKAKGKQTLYRLFGNGGITARPGLLASSSEASQVWHYATVVHLCNIICGSSNL